MSSWHPKDKRRWLPVFVALLLISFIGAEVYRRVSHGNGRIHSLVRAVYHEYLDSRVAEAPPERAEQQLAIYADKLGEGWQDWSWATHKTSATEHVYSGSNSIAMTPEAYKGIYLHHDPVSLAGYGSLQLYVYGHSALTICLVDAGGKFGPPLNLNKYEKQTAKQGWSVVVIPLIDLGAIKLGNRFTGVALQAAGAEKQSDAFLDGIAILPDLSLPSAPTHVTVAVNIDPTADRHPISPYIYGMAFAPDDYLKDLRLGSNRWGGNDKSRYNWVHGNAVNAAHDWRWANRVASSGAIPPGPSSAANQFVLENRVAGAATVLTVPTIGWVAKDTDNNNTSLNVPAHGGPPISGVDGAIVGYDPTENRRRTSLRSVSRKNSPFTDLPTVSDGTIYQDEWIHHLVKAFGTAASGGVPFYSMDNEPDIWDGVHTDVHPAQMGYDDVLANFLDYASAVKAVDPSAQITGPVLSGWTGYLYSALDRGDDSFHTHADCTRHGGEAFIPWFLKRVKANDLKSGKRTLDVLDVHFYPQGQGLYGGATDTDSQDRRLRATRSLWDPTYVDESWIGESVHLIPRLKQWISEGYPGTKIGITEWNYGADKDMGGALAIADVLGILGREDVYLANYWAYPEKNSPGYLAFRMFRNVNSVGRGFGDISFRSVSEDSNRVSCFAATDTSTGDLTLILINKMRKATATVPLTIKGMNSKDRIQEEWILSASNPKLIVSGLQQRIHSGVNNLQLTPYTIVLLRIKPSKE